MIIEIQMLQKGPCCPYETAVWGQNPLVSFSWQDKIHFCKEANVALHPLSTFKILKKKKKLGSVHKSIAATKEATVLSHVTIVLLHKNFHINILAYFGNIMFICDNYPVKTWKRFFRRVNFFLLILLKNYHKITVIT